jgi:hypothetical protein
MATVGAAPLATALKAAGVSLPRETICYGAAIMHRPEARVPTGGGHRTAACEKSHVGLNLPP